MRPKNYIQQNGCHNCKKSFQFYDFDSCITYHCQYKSRKRPLCGSIALNEPFYNITYNGKNEKEYYSNYRSNMRKWDRWASNREVNPWGICDKFELK